MADSWESDDEFEARRFNAAFAEFTETLKERGLMQTAPLDWKSSEAEAVVKAIVRGWVTCPPF